MANPFGSGGALVIPFQREPSSHEAPAPQEALSRVPGQRRVAPVDIDLPNVVALLERIVERLKTRREVGMTARELREDLGSPPGILQRALAVGLRAQRFRRAGSRCGLRYVLND